MQNEPMSASSDGSRPAPTVGAEVFEELDRRSLAREVADQVRALIASGSLAPGDRLPPERELAVRLGVSRPTLREAVGALVIIGLLESRQGAGTFVARDAGEAAARGTSSATTISIDIRGDPLEALFELRILLEPIAAERAASRLSDRELGELRRLFDDLVAHQGNLERFTQLDVEFHRRIQVVSGSPTIISMLDGIGTLALRGRAARRWAPGTASRIVGEHREILEALESHDGFLASAAMTAHVIHARAQSLDPSHDPSG